MPKQRKCPKCKGEVAKYSVETNLGLVVVYACASCASRFSRRKRLQSRSGRSQRRRSAPK